MHVRIQTGDTEPVALFVLATAGGPLTGATDLFVRVRRGDGEYLDWADDTFKAAGWTTLDELLVESDAANAPGVYEVTGGLDTGAITNPNADDNYLIIPSQSPGVTATLPPPGEIKVGQWPEVDATRLLDIFRMFGLDPANPMVITGVEQNAGAGTLVVSIDVVGNTVTLTRTP